MQERIELDETPSPAVRAVRPQRQVKFSGLSLLVEIHSFFFYVKRVFWQLYMLVLYAILCYITLVFILRVSMYDVLTVYMIWLQSLYTSGV